MIIRRVKPVVCIRYSRRQTKSVSSCSTNPSFLQKSRAVNRTRLAYRIGYRLLKKNDDRAGKAVFFVFRVDHDGKNGKLKAFDAAPECSYLGAVKLDVEPVVIAAFQDCESAAFAQALGGVFHKRTRVSKSSVASLRPTSST